MSDGETQELPKEIELGFTLRDPVSGLTGYAVTKHELLGGNIQWGIQPPMEATANVIPDSVFIDEHLLEILDRGISAKCPPIADTDTFQLGDQVKEAVTDFVGIAAERITHLNGCIRYYVYPKAKKNAFPDGMSIDHSRLIKVGSGINKKSRASTKPKAKPTAKKKKAVSKRAPGGPNRKGSDISSAR